MTTRNFVYNLWVLDPYGKPFFYTQCITPEAAEKRAENFKAVYPKDKYTAVFISMCPYQYRDYVWELKHWEDYHEKYTPVTTEQKPAKKKRTKKKVEETAE
jgi:hypothetical protein